jgi:hypothetical protein
LIAATKPITTGPPVVAAVVAITTVLAVQLH